MQRGLRRKWKQGVPVPSGVPPQTTYTFKHALMKTWPINRCCGAPRQQHHQRIAQALRGPVPGDRRDAPRAGRRALHGGGLLRAGDLRTGSGPANTPATARPIWKRSATAPPASSYSRRCQRRPEQTSRLSPCDLALGASMLMTRGHAAPEVGAGGYPGACAVPARRRDAPDDPRPSLACGGYMAGRVATWPTRSGRRCCAWRKRSNAALAVVAHYALGARSCSWVCCPRLASTWRRHSPLHPAQRGAPAFLRGKARGCLWYLCSDNLWCRDTPIKHLVPLA